MKKLLLFIPFVFFLQIAFSQTTYTFTGNGYWTVASNWNNNTIPPAVLPAGDIININPATGDSCVLNTPQTISFGASFNIFPGAIFIVAGGVTISGGLPTVTTDSVYYISNSNATTKGTIVANGGHAITAKGFVFDTLPNPSVTHSDVIYSQDTFNTFYSSVTGFVSNKTYYFRAFATNSAGTGYGAEKSFQTWYNANNDSVFTDQRDGQVYTFRHIGSQVWMTQNLNYVTDSSLCNNNLATNCAVYGRLYKWAEARQAAPPGWHLASDAEWQVLADYLGGPTVAGGKMKSTSSLWLAGNVATNSSGFAALPGGLYNDRISFYDLGRTAYFWTSSEYDSAKALMKGLYYSQVSTFDGPYPKYYRMAVRCIRDNNSLPQLSTDTITNVTAVSATAKGIINFRGSSPVITTGFVWDTLPLPTTYLSTKTVNTVITDTFSSNLINLLPNKTYYIRAYAKNSEGINYGTQKAIYTLISISLPNIVTDTVAELGENYAISGGRVLSNGGFYVSARGVCWNTTGNPDISQNKSINGTGDGSFASNMPNLLPGTTYYYKAYATNSIGTAYGQEKSFTTAPGDSVFTDPRDGQAYTFRHIGSQVWMTRNLNYGTAGWCYGNNPFYCSIFGKLYNWDTALTVAPPGWHLPSDSEWTTLVNYLGGNAVAGGTMKGFLFWKDFYCDTITNSSGFSAYPGGMANIEGSSFSVILSHAYWWSNTPVGTSNASGKDLPACSTAIVNSSFDRRVGLSVRCVRD